MLVPILVHLFLCLLFGLEVLSGWTPFPGHEQLFAVIFHHWWNWLALHGSLVFCSWVSWLNLLRINLAWSLISTWACYIHGNLEISRMYCLPSRRSLDVKSTISGHLPNCLSFPWWIALCLCYMAYRTWSLRMLVNYVYPMTRICFSVTLISLSPSLEKLISLYLPRKCERSLPLVKEPCWTPVSLDTNSPPFVHPITWDELKSLNFRRRWHGCKRTSIGQRRREEWRAEKIRWLAVSVPVWDEPWSCHFLPAGTDADDSKAVRCRPWKAGQDPPPAGQKKSRDRCPSAQNWRGSHTGWAQSVPAALCGTLQSKWGMTWWHQHLHCFANSCPSHDWAVAAKHKETKQFYTLYNTLDDTKLYLDKEVCFLWSCSSHLFDLISQVFFVCRSTCWTPFMITLSSEYLICCLWFDGLILRVCNE